MKYLCLLPSVTGEVYCFPRRQLIFSFGGCVIYHLKGLWEYIPKSVPSVCTSVCTTVFKRIAGLSFYPKSLMLYINEFVSTSSTKKWKAFFFSYITDQFSKFWLKTEKYPKKWRGVNIGQISMCYISMDLSQRALQTNWDLFFKFQISSRNFGRKPKNIQTNREAWILIKVQCVIYQWIWLDKLLKLMWCFFPISESFLVLVIIFFLNNSGVGFMQVRWGKAFVLNSTRHSNILWSVFLLPGLILE